MKQIFSSQKGAAESKAPLIITILILGSIAFLAYKFIPVKWRHIQFEDAVQETLNINYAKEYKEAARGAFNEYTMRDKVLNLAKKFEIPITDPDQQVVVDWPERRIFTVTLDYQVIIKIPIYGDYIWDFHMYVEQDPMSGKAPV